MLLKNIEKRIKHLQSEIAAGSKHDGWTLKGLKEELKLLKKEKIDEVHKRIDSKYSRR